jgi:hypothetical protein
MKKLLLLIALCVVTQGQTKPVEFKLNPDASKVYVNIDQAEAELRRQFDQLEGQRATLLIGAGVPQDSRQCKSDSTGIVICVKPEPAKAEKKQ